MKRMREQGQAPGAPGTQPMAPQNPQQVLAQLRPQSTYMFMSILLRCQKVKKFYFRLFWYFLITRCCILLDGPLSGTSGGMTGQRLLGPNSIPGNTDPFSSLTSQTTGMRPGMVQTGIRPQMTGQTSINQTGVNILWNIILVFYVCENNSCQLYFMAGLIISTDYWKNDSKQYTN